MPNESNLLDRPEIAGPHKGRIGELYDQMSSERLRVMKPAIINWVNILENQSTVTQPMGYWGAPQVRPVVEQTPPQTLVEQDISIDGARQAIDEAMMEIEEGNND